jgi:hypothetical protein
LPNGHSVSDLLFLFDAKIFFFFNIMKKKNFKILQVKPECQLVLITLRTVLRLLGRSQETMVVLQLLAMLLRNAKREPTNGFRKLKAQKP